MPCSRALCLATALHPRGRSCRQMEPGHPRPSSSARPPAAHLLLRPGRLQPDAEGLAPLVARRAGQAVEPGLGVDAAVRLAGREADVGDHGALRGAAEVSPRRPTASSPPHPAPPAGHPPRPGPRSVCRCPGSPPGRSRRPRSRRGSCCTRRRGSRGWTSSRLRGSGGGEAGPGSSGAPQDRRQLRPRGRRGRRRTARLPSNAVRQGTPACRALWHWAAARRDHPQGAAPRESCDRQRVWCPPCRAPVSTWRAAGAWRGANGGALRAPRAEFSSLCFLRVLCFWSE